MKVLDEIGAIYGIADLKIAAKLYVDQQHTQKLLQKSLSRNTKCGEVFKTNGQLVFVKLPREEQDDAPELNPVDRLRELKQQNAPEFMEDLYQYSLRPQEPTAQCAHASGVFCMRCLSAWE